MHATKIKGPRSLRLRSKNGKILSWRKYRLERQEKMSEWKCPRCGLELDRANEWEMTLVDSHLDRHNQETGENK